MLSLIFAVPRHGGVRLFLYRTRAAMCDVAIGERTIGRRRPDPTANASKPRCLRYNTNRGAGLPVIIGAVAIFTV